MNYKDYLLPAVLGNIIRAEKARSRAREVRRWLISVLNVVLRQNLAISSVTPAEQNSMNLKTLHLLQRECVRGRGQIMKGRDNALLNGMAIGGGIMFFGVAYLMYSIGEGVEELVARLSTQVAEINAAHGLSIEVTWAGILPLREAMFVCIIAGILLLALGIGTEAYQRAKEGSSKGDKED